jgi:periplasmic divalent cation tolerance protein
MTAIAVITTVANRKEARALARALVEARLAACAQITRIESIYPWKGAIQHGKEYRVLFKTLDDHYPAVERAIRELHSYELPAIHACAFEHVSPAYAAWIEENVAA